MLGVWGARWQGPSEGPGRRFSRGPVWAGLNRLVTTAGRTMDAFSRQSELTPPHPSGLGPQALSFSEPSWVPQSLLMSQAAGQPFAYEEYSLRFQYK